MASTTETGHYVNLTNFKTIIDRASELTTYDPSNSDLVIATMTAKWTSVNQMHTDYLGSVGATKIPIDDREVLFEKMDRIAVKTLNSYQSTKASKPAKKDAKGLVHKIVGRGIKVKRLENGDPDPKYVSKSQQSYVKKTENFAKLIVLYESDTLYGPNETELKIASLKTMLTAMETANSNIGELIAHMIKLRTNRDFGLYEEETGIIDISLACKKYVISVYGPASPQAKSVTSIYLKRFMKLKPTGSA